MQRLVSFAFVLVRSLQLLLSFFKRLPCHHIQVQAFLPRHFLKQVCSTSTRFLVAISQIDLDQLLQHMQGLFTIHPNWMLLLELMKLLKALQKLWCKFGGLVLAEKLVTGKAGYNIDSR